LTYVDQQLGASGPHLLGEDFTVADAYLFTVLTWTRTIRLDLAPWSHVQAFRERVGQRPAVLAAMRAEGLIR
jgi:glutathione S-transferase